MYLVINQGQVVGFFIYFCDAWLCAFLEFPVFSQVYGPDGYWVVNPPNTN